MFTDLLNRMQSLLQREDISVILNSINETSSPAVAGGAEDDKKVYSALPKIDFNVSDEDLA